MKKPIFENVKEFDDFMDNCIYPDILLPETRSSLAIFSKHKAKELNFIRRSPVEEAEDIIKEFEYCKYHPEGQIVEIRSSDCVKVYEGFNLLKKQLAEKC